MEVTVMCSIIGFCGEGSAYKDVEAALKKTYSRGPDASRIVDTGNGWLGFNRLSIMGLTDFGMQPFLYGAKRTLQPVVPQAENGWYTAPAESEIMLVCNGEIYGFRPWKEELIQNGYTFLSDSDCEILPALYKEYGTDMFRMLDAEFALILYDAEEDVYIAARDPIGIRPLYYGILADGTYVFASEPKNLVGLAAHIFPFPPGCYFKNGEFIKYRSMSEVSIREKEDMETIADNIHDLLIKGVEKRLDSDTPVGFLLSGGLDSSLVCGIAASLTEKPLETWAIGMDLDAIDLKYAKEVADYIHSNHHEVIISEKDVIEALETVIEALGTYDITTIRASVGMYLVCKAIHETSDIRVITSSGRSLGMYRMFRIIPEQ